MAAYCVKATGLWLTHKMENFIVEIKEGGKTRQTEVSQLLAVRIGNFGGVLRKLAPEASLDRDELRFVLFQTHSRLAYLRYVLRGLFGTQWRVPGIELASVSAAVCRDAASSTEAKSRIFVEADGELLGTLPATIAMVRDAVTLLAP
jgi:diacylglycerol kinase family enzyme